MIAPTVKRVKTELIIIFAVGIFFLALGVMGCLIYLRLSCHRSISVSFLLLQQAAFSLDY
jgi:hypothetical protein